MRVVGIQALLALPGAAFGDLRSHGTPDPHHAAHVVRPMDRIDDPWSLADIVHAARVTCCRIGGVVRSLPAAAGPRRHPEEST